MVAVGNIKKITKAMKMVASAKLRRSEEALNVARNFAKAADLLQQASLAKKEEGEKKPESAPGKQLIVAITPDRGLCGSVSAQINRAVKARGNKLNSQNVDYNLITLGEKSRAGLERLFSKHFTTVVTEHSKLKRRTFKQTCLLADYILQTPFTSCEIFNNSFKNMISFESTMINLPTYEQFIGEESGNEWLNEYELEGDDDIMENFYQFNVACILNKMLAETDMVEFSQRVNSMGNSSKSAEDMLSRLKLLYNRSRQAKITTELVEIISGASAADDQKKEK